MRQVGEVTQFLRYLPDQLVIVEVEPSQIGEAPQ